jgi:hypothetical protein
MTPLRVFGIPHERAARDGGPERRPLADTRASKSVDQEGRKSMASSFELPEFLPLRTVASRKQDVGDLCDEVKVNHSSVQTRNGGGVGRTWKVEPEVIRILKRALDQARRGEIIAAPIVFARPNEDKCAGVSAPLRAGRRYLVAACDYLKRDIIAETDD